MRLAGAVHLAGRSLRADPRGAAVNVLAAAAGVAALAFFVALGLGVGKAVRGLFPGDARLVEVVPAAVSLGGVLGGGQLDDAAVERLAAMPGVERAYPKINLRVPVSAAGAPEGLGLRWPEGLVAQIPAVGVDPALLAGDASGAVPFTDRGWGEPIPVMVSARLLEVYNRTFAPTWNLRRLPPGPALVGVQLRVEVGRAVIPLRTEPRVEPARLVLAGLSDRVPVYQVAMPLETVRRLHQAYGKSDAGYSAVALLASAADDVPRVVEAVRRMGFAVDEGERAAAQRVGLVVAVTTLALALLALLMCALSALAIAQSLFGSVRARAREVAVLQAVGASRADVRALVLVEAAAVGLSGGLLGAIAARLGALAADAAARRLLPDLPFRPESFFAFPAWLWAAALAIGLGAALAGALAPARAAARTDPARALS